MNTTFLKFAASTLAIGTLAGVSPVAQSAFSSDAPAVDARAQRDAQAAAADAREALADGQPERAVRFAERAVEAMPYSAEYRHLLGQSYMAAGRFNAAETSFQDALTINPDLDRTAFNLALTEIALGNHADARAELRDLEGRIGASDIGLAIALAGDHERAIDILRIAARANGGDPHARQNLALAYALAGRWAEARITAAQDVSLAQLDQRMREWMQFAQPQNRWDQVAGLLNIDASNAAADPGQPTRLALGPVRDDVMLAEAPVAAPVATPVVAFTAPVEEVEVAATGEADRELLDSIRTLTDSELDAPVIAADAEPMRVAPPRSNFIVEDEVRFAAVDPAPAAPVVTHRAAPAAVPVPAAASAPRRAAAPAPVRVVANGNYVVQIGAFAHEANVERAWNQAVARYAALDSYTPSRAEYERGRVLHRLSFGSFDSQRDASGMCRTLRSRGIDCFVRVRAGDSPMQMAALLGAGAEAHV